MREREFDHMHMEPGIVDGTKIVLSYATAAGAAGQALRLAFGRGADHAASLALRSLFATALVFSFFEVLPHVPVGISEVHLILGSTLLLLFGAVPAAVGLAGGLAVQGLFFAPYDLPQYFMNVTTLLVPLFAIEVVARRIIPAGTAYVDLTYGQVARLSFTYQGGIVAWVAFWAFYGRGFGAETLTSVTTFGAAYMLVVLVEPLVDLAVLALAKAARASIRPPFVTARLFHAA